MLVIIIVTTFIAKFVYIEMRSPVAVEHQIRRALMRRVQKNRPGLLNSCNLLRQVISHDLDALGIEIYHLKEGSIGIEPKRN